MIGHQCVFDSEQGFLPQIVGLSLRCKCGRWQSVGKGRLDLPEDIEDVAEWKIMLLVAVLFLVALWAL